MGVMKDMMESSAEMMRPHRLGERYSCTYDFVVKHGWEFQPQQLPDRYEMGTPKECYTNSQLLAMVQDLIYVEGFASFTSIPIPLSHAWCVERDNPTKVIDVTATDLGEYWGIAFTPEYTQHTALNAGLSTFIDNYVDKWPLLRMTDEELAEVIWLEHKLANGV